MTIVEQRVAEVTILRLKGRLELDEGDVMLRDHVNRLAIEGRVQLLIDLKDVTRMDSAGIGMLAGKFMTVRRQGGTMRLLHLTARTGRLMHITKLETIFEIFHDEDVALQTFGVTP